MELKTKHKEQIATSYVALKPLARSILKTSFSFASVEDAIVANGGRIVDLDEPKLTHVVLDKRDISRRKELMKRTSKLVPVSWLDCTDSSDH